MKAWTEHACQSKVLCSCLQSTVLFLACFYSLIARLSSLIARIFRVRRDERVGYALDMTLNANIKFWKHIYFERNMVQSSMHGSGVWTQEYQIMCAWGRSMILTQVIDMQARGKPAPDGRARSDGLAGGAGGPFGRADRAGRKVRTNRAIGRAGLM